MSLDKQKIQLSLGSGIDTKTDKKQVQGKLLQLQNGIFQTGQEIRKRNGYAALPPLGAGVGLASYNNELISLDGSSLFSYDSNGQLQINKGSLVTTAINTTTVVRNTFQQTSQDSAVNGTLQCFVWNDSSGAARYSVFDTTTNQSIVNNQPVNGAGPSFIVFCKVLAVGNFFVIIGQGAAGTAIRYAAINIATPTVIAAPVTIASDTNATSGKWDVSVIGNNIAIAYDGTAHVSAYLLSSTLVLSAQFNAAGEVAISCITVFGDGSNHVWVAYHNGTTVRVFVVNAALTAFVLAATTLTSPVRARNITGFVVGTTATIFTEVQPGVGQVDNLIDMATMTLAGVSSANSLLSRDVGLASKAFIFNAVIYVMVAHSSPLQPTYFLMSQSGQIVAKISQDVGGGYTAKSLLPEVNFVSAGVYLTASLIKDLLTAISGAIYTQTGVIAAQISFISTPAPSKFVLGENLHFAGGIVNMYDGANVVEHGFNVFPEGLTAALTGSLGSGLAPGTTGLSQYQYSAVYEWTDNQGQLHRSAPSVPLSVSTSGYQPKTFTGTFTTGTHVTITGIADTSTIRAGQYVNFMAGQFSPNDTVVSVDSSSQITVSSGYNNTGATAPRLFLVTTQPIAFVASSKFTIGSNVIVIPNGSGNLESGIIVGQTYNWNINSPGIIIPSPFAGPVIVTAYTPTVAGVSDGMITVNQAASLSYDLTGSPTSILYSIETLQASVVIPTLRLSAKTKVSIALYRTVVDGTVFFRTTSPINLVYNNPTADTITIVDTTTDGALIGNEQLYTTGGVVDNIAIPAVNLFATFKSRAIAVPSENTLSWLYSQQVIPGVPVQFSDVFEENIDSRIGSIAAVGVIDDKLIFFGPTSVFYVVGDGPTPSGTNNTFSEAQLISSDVGCTNQQSLVLTPDGLMFQSAKGIYLLDRSLAVKYIGADVEAFNAFTVTSAQLMNTVNQARFTLSSGTSLVYDYYYRQWDTFTNQQDIDSCLFKNNFTLLSPAGLISTETPGAFGDPGNAAILISLTSNWLSFANIQGFQRIYSMLVLGEWKSAHTITVNIFTDFNDATPFQTVVIPFLTQPIGAYQYRVFFTQQKCEAMKIQIVESQSVPGEGFSISNIAFIVGIKTGLNKVTAAQSFG